MKLTESENNAISITNLSLSRAKKKVLNNIQLKIPRGIIYGLIGPNGAGKSTLLKCILGFLTPENGVISFEGSGTSGKKRLEASKVGFIIEAPALYDHLTGYENLLINQIIFKVDKARIDLVLELTGIADSAQKKVSQYSTGMKQRLGWALALLHDPELLILDEPLTSLDPRGIKDFYNLLLSLKESGKTILITSHMLLEMERICDYIGLLNNGKILFDGALSEIQTNQTLRIQGHFNRDIKVVHELFQDRVLRYENNILSLTLQSGDEFHRLNKLINDHGFAIEKIELETGSLEKFFFTITNNEEA